MLWSRKEKVVFPEKTVLAFREIDKRRESNMKSNNQINVPQAREAMDKFKMQAASDLDVFFTS